MNRLAWIAMIVNTIDVLICIVIAVILAKRNRDDEAAGAPVKTTSIDEQEDRIGSLQEELLAARTGYNAIEKENLELKNKLAAQKTESEKVASKCSAIEQDFKKNAEELRVLRTKGAKPDDLGRQVEMLNKEIEGYKDVVSGFKKGEEEKQKRIRSLEEELKTGKDNFLAAEKQSQESKRKEADFNNEIARQKKIYDDSRIEVDKLVKENLEFKNKLTVKETESEKTLSNYAVIEKDLKIAVEELKALKEKAAQPNEFAKQIESLKKEIEDGKAAAAKFKKGEEEKQNGIRLLQDELKHVKESFIAAEKQLQESKRKEADFTNEISRQKKLCDAGRIEMDKLVKEALEFKDKLLSKEAASKELLAKYSAMEKDFKKNAEQLQALKAKSAKSDDLGVEVQNLRKENSDFKNKLVHKEEELKNALSKHSSIEKEFKHVSEELKLYKTKNVKLSEFEQLKKEMETLNSSASELKRKDDHNTKRISSLQEELKASQDSYSVARSELQEVSQQALNSSKELNKQKNLLEANNAELERLRKENPELVDKLNNKMSEMQNVLSDYSSLEKEFEKVSEEVEALKIENAELISAQAAAEEANNKAKEADNLGPELKKQEEKPAEISEEQNEAFLADLRSKSRQKYLQIGEIMLEQNAVTREALTETFEYQEKYGGSIAMYLINHAHIDELKLAQTICHQFGVPYLPLSSYDVSAEIIKLVPMDIAEKHWLIPLQKSGSSLSLAMVDPFDFYAIDTIEKKTGYKVQAFVGVLSDIIQAMENYYKIIVKETDYKGQRTTPIFITTEVYKGIERRQCRRVNVNLDVSFPYKGDYRKSGTKDVSEGGFLLDSDVALETGLVIPLQVDLPKEISLWPIVAVIQVLRVRPAKDDRFDVAVKTIKIAKEEVDMIIKYALEHKEKEDK